MTTLYLSLENVIALQAELIKKYGGLPGIRDRGLLESALNMPKTIIFGQEMYPSVYEKAAAYLFHIVSNHPFIDANKRTGYAATMIFLEMNNMQKKFKKEDLEELVLLVAQSKVEKEQIAEFFKTGSIFVLQRMSFRR